jgi:hypothetical protein
MPLVSMRQLLDEAAKGGYGVGAFNVNNMEQIQAIMEAAREDQVAGHRPGQPRRPPVFAGSLLYHLMQAAAELYPEIPDRHAPGSRQQLRDLQERHRARLHLGHDGWLAQGRRQDPDRL